MNIIVAVDKNWGIGANNNLLFHLKKDLAFFKEKTLNKVVVMGQATLESLKNAQPLPNRTNIVLSNDPTFAGNGATVVRGLEELFILLKQKNYDTNDVFVIGGASVYQQLLPYCKTAYITKIDAAKPATKFFPNLTDHDNWKEIYLSTTETENEISFCFSTYVNINPLEF